MRRYRRVLSRGLGVRSVVTVHSGSHFPAAFVEFARTAGTEKESRATCDLHIRGNAGMRDRNPPPLLSDGSPLRCSGLFIRRVPGRLCGHANPRLRVSSTCKWVFSSRAGLLEKASRAVPAIPPGLGDTTTSLSRLK